MSGDRLRRCIPDVQRRRCAVPMVRLGHGMITLTEHAGGTIVPVRAQPGARKNAVLGERAGALRVAVSAAPERGKANDAIAQVLAEALGCKGSQVALVAGATSRDKRFLVTGMTPEEIKKRMDVLCDENRKP